MYIGSGIMSMKINKKSITVKALTMTLPVLSAIIIAGCQWTPFGTTTNNEGVGKEKLVTEAVKKIASAGSTDIDIDAKMTAAAKISGIGVGVNAITDLNVKSAKENNASHAKGNITFDLIGQMGSVDIETYSLDKDNVAYTYINENNKLTGDSGWFVTKNPKTESAGDSISDSKVTASLLSLGDMLGLYNTANDSIAALTIKDGTVTIEGKECYVVEGPLKGENVQAITDGLGFSIPGVPGLPKPELSGIEADIKMYFEKESKEPYVIELKIPEVTGTTEGNPVNFSIENIDATIRFNSFDSNNVITVPEEVEKNAVLSVDMKELQSLFGGN